MFEEYDGNEYEGYYIENKKVRGDDCDGEYYFFPDFWDGDEY